MTQNAAPKPNIAIVAPQIESGKKLQPIVPSTWQDAVSMAGAFVRAGMVPKHFEGSVEKATVAIVTGLEVGLTPMAALQSIAVINNMPTIYGDGLVALVRASGFLEDLQEGMKHDAQGVPTLAWCKVKRKGEASWKERALTQAECVRAGWWKKAGPWTLTPARMMQVRVRGWLLRDVFADVLRGLHSAEEVQDMVDVTPQGGATTVLAAEPQRKDYVDKPAEPQPSTPPSAEGTGQPEEAAGEEKPAPSGPPVTDVVDQNAAPPPEHAQPGQKLEFARFSKTTKFITFAESFLPKTNAEGARQFSAFYDGTLIAMDRGKPATKEAADFIRAQIKEIIDPPDRATA